MIGLIEAKKWLSYDCETGVFTWAVDTLMPNGGIRRRAGEVAGGVDEKGYVRVRVAGGRYKAHRLAVLFMTGEWPTGEVDHINHMPSDNRWANLRDVSRSTNQQNQIRATSNSATGIIGAHKKPHGFVSQITVNGRNKYLGYFKAAKDANAAYVAAKRKLHDGCTL